MKTVLACTSAASCVTSFIVASLPYLQFIALLISISAGLAALIAKHRSKR